MVDIHCHILPNLDDGSSCPEESVAMARLAVASGVTDIITTPHFRGEAAALRMLPAIMGRLARLQDALARENLPLRLHPGAEILCTPDTPRMGARGELPTLGESRYLLTEFYFNETGAFMDDILDALARQGYWPVIAHPERFEAVQADPELARHWFDKGYLLQVNKGSVLGGFGRRVRQTAAVLLETGIAHLFASDAHGADVRTPYMTELRSWAEENLGPSYTWILMEENPARILRGQQVLPPEG